MIRSLAEIYGNTFNYEGRAKRRQYLGFIIFQLLYATVWFAATIYRMEELGLTGSAQDVYLLRSSITFGIVLLVFFYLPGLSLTARRLRDANWSGWWIFAGIIGFAIGQLFLFAICTFWPGSKGENRFGPDPRDAEGARWEAKQAHEAPPEEMGFFKAVGTVFRKTFNFYGRARRKEYWYFFLFQAATGLGIYAAMMITIMSDPRAAEGLVAALNTPALFDVWYKQNVDLILPYGLALAGLSLLFWLPGLAVTIRRLHDTDRSGWFIFMPALVTLLCLGGMFGAAFVAMFGGIVGLILMIVLGLIPSLAYVWFFVVLCLPGSFGDNRFGPDSVPNRRHQAPSHPAFAPPLQGADRAAFEAARKAEIKDYYRRNVLPTIQKS